MSFKLDFQLLIDWLKGTDVVPSLSTNQVKAESNLKLKI
jgi:hypothetical protein